MADWNTAYNWMMDNEDAARACAQVADASPEGVAGSCFAISGINSGAWPVEFAAIAAADQASREPRVQRFYQDHFWNYWLAHLNSDELCKANLRFCGQWRQPYFGALFAASGQFVLSWQSACRRWRMGPQDHGGDECLQPGDVGCRLSAAAGGILPGNCCRQS
jgi:hypothetical protein